MKRLLYILCFLFLFLENSLAQNYSVFSQYVNNGLLLSPAYTGSREVLSLNLMYRNQWAGFEGGPVFQTFSAHAPLKGSKIALGLLVLDEKEGAFHNTQAYFNYAYRMLVGNGRLSMGLRIGVDYGSYNLKSIYLNDQGDNSFSGNTNVSIKPNMGVGIYFYNHNSFLGFSIPYLLSYKVSGIYHDFNNYTYLLTGGYLFDFSRGFKLKPTVLLKYNSNFKQQLDLNLNAILLNNKLCLGAAYRMKDAYIAMLEVQLNSQFRIGYSFEYSARNISYFNNTSHEIGLRYEFSYKIKAFNPRYF
jgi:type IX secretion system PorP/SprF family membrane protein